MIMIFAAFIDNDEDLEFILNLYFKYNKLIYKKISDKISTKNEKEDLVNDTFIKLIDKIETLKALGEEQLLYYIARTADNTAKNYIRKNLVLQKHIYYGEDTDLRDEIAEFTESEDEYTYLEQFQELAYALLTLQPMDYDLLMSKYIDEKNDKEIAAEIGISENSVRTYLSRARRKARKLMEERIRDQ